MTMMMMNDHDDDEDDDDYSTKATTFVFSLKGTRINLYYNKTGPYYNTSLNFAITQST